MNASRRACWLYLFGALALVAFASLPWLVLLWNKISPLALASEGIGYRFIHPLRLQLGEAEIVFAPQGQTLGLFHHVVIRFDRLMAANGPTPLRAWFDGFAFATNALFAALIFTAFYLVRARRASAYPMAAVLLFAIYGSRSGIFFCLDPDYYAFELVSGLMVISFSSRWQEGFPRRPFWAVSGTAVLAGLMAGIKITLAPLSLLVLFPLLVEPALRWSARIRLSALFGLVAGTVYLGVISIYYVGRFDLVPIHLRMLFDFVHQAGAEDRFWPSLLNPHSPLANPGADYGYARAALIFWAIAVLMALVGLWRRPNLKRAVLVGTALVLAVIAVGGLVVRPAGTTLWEVTVGLLVGAACIILTLPTGFLSCVTRTVFCGGLLLAAAQGGLTRFNQGVPVARLRLVSAAIWESHADFMAGPSPHCFVYLDSDHVAGVVAESLMKGCQDFPNPRIGAGQAAMKVLAGDLQIVGSTIEAPSRGSMLIVLKPGERAQGLPSDGELKLWDLTLFPWWPRTALLYRAHRGDAPSPSR